GSEPAAELAPHQMLQQFHARRAVVEAGKRRELLTAMLAEEFRVLDGDLLERLDAVGREAGRDHGEAPHALVAERPHRLIGIGLEPFGAAETGLEGEPDLLTKRAEPRLQEPDRRLAMLAIGVALLDILLRQAVERGEDHL